jgi:hypothetical protein
MKTKETRSTDKQIKLLQDPPALLRIRIRMILSLPDPDPLVQGTDPEKIIFSCHREGP